MPLWQAHQISRRDPILHRATEVRADGGEGLPLGIVDAHQEGRFVAKLDDLAGVRLEVLDLAGVHLFDGNLGNPRRDEEARHGVEERSERRGDTPAEKPGDDRAPAGIGAWRGGIPFHPMDLSALQACIYEDDSRMARSHPDLPRRRKWTEYYSCAALAPALTRWHGDASA